MRIHRLICTALCCASVLAAASRNSWADHITELVVFGDSLSDAGNVFDLTGGTFLTPPYYEGRASNGPVWVEQLASRLGVPIPTASRTGGTNFAYGGAQTGSGTWFDPNADATIPNVELQIDEFMARGQPLRDDQLVVLWAGANDILNSGRDPALVVSNLTEHMRTLNAAGGTNFLTPNLWQIDNRFRVYNQLWANELNALQQSLPITVTSLDIPGVTQKIFANPAAYGITRLQGQAFNQRTGEVVPNPNEYLVWDQVGHPTEALHGIIADAAYDLLVADPRHATLDEMRLVVPKGNADQEGDAGAWPGTVPFRALFMFFSSEFDELPPTHCMMTGLSLRPDGSVSGPREVTWRDSRWIMSTNPSDELADTLSGSHGDNPVTVYSGELIMETDNSGAPEGPKDFDYRLDFQTPYFYHPDEGNLILDIEAPFGYQPALLDDAQYDPDGRIVEIGNLDLSDRAVYTFTTSLVPEFTFASSELCGGLQAGDADRDLDFDQLDLVKVQIAAKFLSGQPATWGEGDWDGAPGGHPASPPAGNGLFDQLDIVKALTAGVYLTGRYAAILPDGNRNDGQTSVGYDARTGELWVDAPAASELTSINIDSAAGIFVGDAAQNLGGSFDNDADSNIFKATFGSSFGSLSFGNVAQAGLEEQFLLNDLSVVGSLSGGGALGDVDLVYVPEPTGLLLASVAMVILVARAARRRRTPYEHVTRARASKWTRRLTNANFG